MDTPGASPDTTTRRERDDLDEIGARLAAVMQPAAEPVDVAAYLLHPPPTADAIARRDRQRRFVRTGSLVGAALLAVVLLVPLPGRDHEGASPHADPVASDTAAPYPQRVDVPVAPGAPTRTSGRRAASSGHGVEETQGAGTIGGTGQPRAASPRRVAGGRGGAVPAAHVSATSSVQGAEAAPQVATSNGVAASGAAPAGASNTTSSDAPSSDMGVGTSRAGRVSG